MTIKEELTGVLNTAIFEALSNLHTMTIAIITAVGEKTISCKPVINRVVGGESIELPVFEDVPPVFMKGGGSYTAYPIAIGDYCLLLFSERCFDRWWNGQDFQPPLEFRMHDYSDGFALVGVNPLAGLIEIPTVIQQTGDTNQDGDYTHQGNRNQTGNYTVTGDVEITGNLQVNGNITCTGTISAAAFSGLSGGPVSSSVNFETTADVKAGDVSLNTHTHPYTWTDPAGSGDTGGPN